MRIIFLIASIMITIMIVCGVFIYTSTPQILRDAMKKEKKLIKAIRKSTTQSNENQLITAQEVRENFLAPSEEIIQKIAKAQYEDINETVKTASKNGNRSVDFYIQTPQDSPYPLKREVTKYISDELTHSGFMVKTQLASQIITISW